MEWVPDPLAGRLLYDAATSASSDEEVLRVMWAAGGATEENPRPYLKTVLCRIVSIATVQRTARRGGVDLALVSLPRDPDNEEESAERSIVETFLGALGRERPQIVGFNSIDADLKILLQRGLIFGVRAEEFCRRPEKPWQGADYFARGNEWHIDLRGVVGGFGRAAGSLHEIAVLSGIPGKLDVDGSQVAELWLAGLGRRIVEYNEFDALTTYLLWLRVAHFAGHFTSDEYAEEQRRVRDLIEREIKSRSRPHLEAYLAEWDRLRQATSR